MQQISKTFRNNESTPDVIGKASETGFKCIYNCAVEKYMTKIRYQKYADMSCRGNIQPEKLPPSERACFYHGLRTFSQIMEWKNIDEERGLNLLDWG